MSVEQSSAWSETVSTDLRKVVNVLVPGRKLASELQILLRKLPGDQGQVLADDLATKIVQAFSDALLILSSTETRDSTCQSPITTQVGSPMSDDQKSEHSGDKRGVPASKDRRGGNKRRKASQVWTRETPTPIDDGCAWRKYGQKEILNAKYPRNYFRCTHKHDQGCQATKQVQRTGDDPPVYRTIYMGHHTCKDTLKPPQLILDSYPEDSSRLLNFQTATSTDHNHQSYSSFFTSFLSSSSSIKSECPQDIQSGDDDDDLTHIKNQSSSDYLLSPDLTSFESSGRTMILGSTSTSAGSDHGDVISSVFSSPSSQSLDDFFTGHVCFDDVFPFDEEIP